MKQKPTYLDLETEIKELRKKLSNKNNAEDFKEIEHKKISEAVSQSANIIVITDTDGNIEYVNENFTVTTGYTKKEVIGQTPHLLNAGKQEKEYYTQLWKTIKAGEKWKGEFCNKTKNGTIYWEQATITSIKDDNNNIINFLAVKENITERKKNEKELKQRENYLIALNKTSEILFTDNPKIQIQEFTEIIGKAAHASRTYIFKNHKSKEGELLLSQISEYVTVDIKPEIDNPQLQNLSYNDWIPRWHKILEKGDIIKGKVADFPQTEREILESQEIKAVLIIPIMIGKEFWGFIGFDNCINDNDWQTTEVEYLKASAEKISTKFEEYRKQKLLENENKRFHTTMDSVDAGIYVADMQTHELLFINENLKKIFGDKIGEKCYKTLQGLDAPCDFCTNNKLLDKNGNPTESYVWESKNSITKQWYQLRDKAIQWTDGRLVRLEIATEITERKDAELIIHNQNQEYEALNEELRISNEELHIGKAQIQEINSQLTATINALPDLMFETDSEGRIYNYHAPKSKLLYVNPEEFLGKRIDKIFPKKSATICNNAIKEAIKTGNHFGANYSLQLPQGLSWFELSIALKKDNNTDEKRVVMLIRDITVRKTAEQNLIKSNEFIQNITANVPSLIFQYELNTKGKEKFNFVSKGIIELMELEPQDVIEDATNIWNTYEEKFIPEIVEKIKISQEKLLPWHVVYQIKTAKTQKIKWVEGRGVPECMPNGNIIWNGYVIDITDRKKAQQSLSESKNRLKAFSEVANEAIFFSEKGICIEANQKASELFGYTYDEFIGMFGTDIVAAESKELVSKNILSGYEKPYDAVAQKKDGTKFYAEFHGKTYKYKGKEIRVTAVRDITDRKKAEQEIKESERKLKEAQQIAHVGHWELDLVNNVLIWSDEIYRMFDLTPQEFVATYEAFLNNIHPDDRDKVNKAYTDSIKNKTPYKIEYRLLSKTGKIKYVLEQCDTKYDKHGKPILSFGTVFDITELKKIDKLKIAKAKLEKNEQKLKKQNKEYESLNEEYKTINEELIIAKEETEEKNQKLKANNIEIEKINKKLEDYSYTVSHDLKEPIRSIRTFSQFILEDYADKFDEEATDYLNRIIRASSRMAYMIEDLLELSRVGRVDIEFTKTNISKLIQEVEDSLIQKIRKTNTKISYANLPEIICQPVWIKAVFQNLITNSINYNNKNQKEILITYKEFNNKHEFAIKDNGNGIPENQFIKIFGLFRKSHKNINTKSSGAGLAIVSAVIEEHKGKIWVDWSEINIGTIIKFTIMKISK